MTFDSVIKEGVRTMYMQRSSPVNIDWAHLQKVMDARKEQKLSYSLIYHVSENNSLKATILADPTTKKPTFVIAY